MGSIRYDVRTNWVDTVPVSYSVMRFTGDKETIITATGDKLEAYVLAERLNLQAMMLREQAPPDPPWKDKPLTGGLDVSVDGVKGWHPW